MTDVNKFNPKLKAFKEIKWIPIKNLSVVWTEAQRPLNSKHAQMIADSFDPEMFGTIAVTKPNGHGVYHVIDGHHRKVAVEKLWGADESIPCQVFDAEDPARAAQLFDHINSGRKAPSPLELFKVRVAAGNELQVGVNNIVLKCGYTATGHQANSIACVAALEAVYHTHGPVVLEATLRLIKKIWGGDDVTAVCANIVRGIGSFLSEYRHADMERLVQAMANKYTPARLQGAAKTAREMTGGNISTAIKELMVTTYNATVRSEKAKLKSKGK